MIDYAIYNHARGGRTAVQRYWQTHRPGAGSLEAVVRDAMLDTSYTLFRIVRVRPGVGVDVEAMLLDDSGLMVDINFSRSAVPDLVFAARLLRFDGFAISSGATLAPSAEALDDIIRDTDRLSDRAGSMSFEAFRREAHACIMRACFKNPAPVVFTHLDPEITPEEFHRLAQRREAALRAAGRNGPLALGSIDDDDDSLEWIPPLESTRRIGRNEPCPCGSGRKYKKCCGGGAASGIQSRTAL
jgi:hypothetical protein